MRILSAEARGLLRSALGSSAFPFTVYKTTFLPRPRNRLLASSGDAVFACDGLVQWKRGHLGLYSEGASFESYGSPVSTALLYAQSEPGVFSSGGTLYILGVVSAHSQPATANLSATPVQVAAMLASSQPAVFTATGARMVITMRTPRTDSRLLYRGTSYDWAVLGGARAAIITENLGFTR